MTRANIEVLDIRDDAALVRTKGLYRVIFHGESGDREPRELY